MNVSCRDLGRMDYRACWELQRQLFDALVARKRGAGRDETAPNKAGRDETAPDGGWRSEPIQDGTGSNEVAGAAQEDTGSNKAAGADLGAGQKGTGSNEVAGVDPGDGAHESAEAPRNKSGEGDSDRAGTILLVEHPPVYTLGKSGRAENLLIDRTALEALGARFFHIDRGGDITFHGPGQLVCYPILDLERLGIGLRAYIEALEEAVIRTVAHYGIRAGRIAGASGVWIGGGAGAENAALDALPDACRRSRDDVPRKICAIGVRSSRYITMHGFALNVSTDLSWFSRINPCGFTDRGVTSIERETGRGVAINEVKHLVMKHLSEILNVKIYNN